MENVKNWYVVCTKPRYERKVADTLEKKKVSCYYPRYNEVQYWQEKRKIINVPLFKSYLFVYANEEDHSAIKQIEGVSGILYWLQKPAIINAEEIRTLKGFLQRNSNIRLEKIHVHSTTENNSSYFNTQKQTGALRDIGNINKVCLPSLGYMLVSESVVEEGVKIVA